MVGKIEMLPVVPNWTPIIVVVLFQIESAFIVMFELELEKSLVTPEGVVMEELPVAIELEVHPPKRMVFAPLECKPKLTPRESELVELSPLRVIGPLTAKMSMKSKYKPSDE